MTNLERLREILGELFQLDQADLDFGIYRIMNAKRAEILQFLDDDLLPQVQDAFKAYQADNRAAVEAELDQAIEKAKELGADPETLPRVKDLRAKLAQAVDVTALENEVYSHLYNFFRRYYQEGDFISLRRYKEGVYAIPYEGEEVKLHWANRDQYYIKTSEYLRDYTFKLPSGKRVHFKLAQANTEKDNNRAPNGNERRFILSQEQPLAEESGELVIRFDYRPHPDQANQADLNAAAVDRVVNQTTGLDDWRRELAASRPTEKNPNRTLLEKHLTDYTARNTFDYFIHKDLGGFLARELDFYIKNEVMHLDDVESDAAPHVEQYLSKIKAIRRIAHKLIAFLAQIENFQKKLWLKKKFVVETQYCITLDRIFAIDDEKARGWLVDQILGNDAQREEWISLCAIDEVKGDLATPGYSKPLKVEFLKAHSLLVVDTSHFPAEFRIRLLAAIADLDEIIDGLLIHSENFQAVGLLDERYRSEIKCIYIDPPYNTGSDEFTYKDRYQHSSWLAMMTDRLLLMRRTLKPEGTFFTSIDHNEISSLKAVLDGVFQGNNLEGLISWRRRHNQPNDRTKMIGLVSEYLLAYAKDGAALRRSGVGKLDLTGEFSNPDNDPRGDWASKPWKVGAGQSGTRYLIETPTGKTLDEEWMGDESTYKALLDDSRIIFPRGGDGFPRKKYFRFEREEEGQCAANWWEHSYFGHNAGANATMTALFGEKNLISNPKPVELIRGVVQVAGRVVDLVADFFAGSGTTGHAVINLNRENGVRRKFILVEMGDYFGTVLVPRIKKVIFTPEWQDGKPKRMAKKEEAERSPRVVKVIRLESYEDALNNLELKRTGPQQTLLEQQAGFREDYLLRYMLDVEARESPSLLNVERFEDPFNYKLNIATGTAGETKPTVVDLVETFNYLIGLRMKTIDDVRGVRVVTGMNPQGERVLVLWRKTRELDNDALDAWFHKQGYNTKDQEYDVIYVNGDNNLENLRKADQTWKVRLTEEEFKRLMFDVQDV